MGICRGGICILVWLVTGPTFHFSDTWQLIINTATTIITFLMVFLIQNTQNRDAKAMHLKLDEDLSDEELKKIEEQFQHMRKRAENNGKSARHVEPNKSAERAR
jgi:low affinity Fe/Cu permease